MHLIKHSPLWILLAVSAFAGVQQKDHVHQYIVREAWELLRTQYPAINSSDLAGHIGYSEQGTWPWQTGLVVTGAWREDREDPLYGYGGFDLFGFIDPVLVSATHFWNADLGDEHKLHLTGIGYFENNYRKARDYLYGGHVIFRAFEEAKYMGMVGGCPPEIIFGYLFSYDNLFHFYNTGEYYNHGRMNFAGQFCLYPEPIQATMPIEDARRFTYEILGRICHLIADTGTPAHAHNDIHIPQGIDPDTYEEYMGSHYSNWTYQNALNAGGTFFDIQSYNYPLRFLMYTTNQIADHFPSDDRSGDNNYSATYDGDTYTVLDDIYATLGSPPSSVNPSDIADHAFVYSIRTTATLLYWFALETNQIQPPQPLSVNITGPSSLQSGQTGTWTANVSGGVPPYDYAWYKLRDCGDFRFTASGIEPNYIPCGYWFSAGGNSPTLTLRLFEDHRIKVVVTDNIDQTATATKYVRVGGGLRKQIVQALPETYTLAPNHPNPFNPTTTIRCELPEASRVSLVIYDMLGREVRSWHLREEPGYKQMVWDGKDQSGQPVTTGVYIYRLTAVSTESDARFTASRKMVMIR